MNNLLIDKHDQISEVNQPITRITVRDPTDNGRVLRNDSRDVLFEWCKENCQGRFWIGMGFGQFEIDEDAVLFKLRWG